MAEDQSEITNDETVDQIEKQVVEEPEAPDIPEVTNDGNLAERVSQFLDAEGERIRQETDRIQSPIIAQARLEYKKRLAAFLEEQSNGMKEDAVREAASVRNKAEAEAEEILNQARNARNQMELESRQQAEKIIEDAKLEVSQERQRMIEENQKYAEKIISEAKETASRLVSEANESVQKILEEEREKILAEARTKAYEQSQTIISNSWQRSQQMLDSAEKAYNLVRTQLQNCVKAILEADNNMEDAIAPNTTENDKNTIEEQFSLKANSNVAMAAGSE